MSAPNVAEVLESAADLLQPEGAWIQGRAYGPDNPDCMCVLGAMWKCQEGVDGIATEFLRNFLGQWPADWNDAPERTQAEVVAKLREAAALARSETSS